MAACSRIDASRPSQTRSVAEELHVDQNQWRDRDQLAPPAIAGDGATRLGGGGDDQRQCQRRYTDHGRWRAQESRIHSPRQPTHHDIGSETQQQTRRRPAAACRQQQAADEEPADDATGGGDGHPPRRAGVHQSRYPEAGEERGQEQLATDGRRQEGCGEDGQAGDGDGEERDVVNLSQGDSELGHEQAKAREPQGRGQSWQEPARALACSLLSRSHAGWSPLCVTSLAIVLA